MGKSYKRHKLDYDDSGYSDYKKPSKDEIREQRKRKQQEHDEQLPGSIYPYRGDDDE
jgi:hypothetical protein